jgi:hypothetical protein
MSGSQPEDRGSSPLGGTASKLRRNPKPFSLLHLPDYLPLTF